MIRVLVFYDMDIHVKQRKTILQHLYAFNQHADVEAYYYNIRLPGRIHNFVLKLDFDLIVYHYTFIGARWGRSSWHRLESLIPSLTKLKGYQVCIPQDEYFHSRFMCEFFKKVGVKTVFTCASEKDWQTLYPTELAGLEHYVTVLTGYVDENKMQEIQQEGYILPHQNRHYDVGYRARKNPYSLGYFALRKWHIARLFEKEKKHSILNINVSTHDKDVFYGNDWYKFLGQCRVILGTEGGASLHDPDGYIEEKVRNYLTKNPAATFEECQQKCFSGLDGNLSLFLISPRHFEACMTKTCQILVEGNYNGILQPNQHYIPIKADFSDLQEVLEKIQDKKYCEQIAEQAYVDIILSRKYTYHAFVQQIITHVQHVTTIKPYMPKSIKERCYLFLLKLREKHPSFWEKLYYTYESIIRTILNWRKNET